MPEKPLPFVKIYSHAPTEDTSIVCFGRRNFLRTCIDLLLHGRDVFLDLPDHATSIALDLGVPLVGRLADPRLPFIPYVLSCRFEKVSEVFHLIVQVTLQRLETRSIRIVDFGMKERYELALWSIPCNNRKEMQGWAERMTDFDHLR
ncbi:hypothetical protein [Streptomyces sp. NPDC006334]|uniref:hypothetical protein n=1 Tax=Streptomyces sp. NPDC006334 TaxID=3156754 RepID=UPI0033ACC0E3